LKIDYESITEKQDDQNRVEYNEFHRSGKLKWRCVKVNGLKEGLEQRWNEQGDLMAQSFYAKGEELGLSYMMSEQGQIM
jgi:antitoxin component YwqK of YwqJK toxin-antitoxin module